MFKYKLVIDEPRREFWCVTTNRFCLADKLVPETEYTCTLLPCFVENIHDCGQPSNNITVKTLAELKKSNLNQSIEATYIYTLQIQYVLAKIK